jgi:hypothetical protein
MQSGRQIVTNILQKPTAPTFTVKEWATREDESTDIQKCGCEWGEWENAEGKRDEDTFLGRKCMGRDWILAPA